MMPRREEDERLMRLVGELGRKVQAGDGLMRRLYRIMGRLRRLDRQRKSLTRRIKAREAELRSEAAQRAHETMRRRRMVEPALGPDEPEID